MALLSEFQVDGAPHWATGCESCQFGVVAAPEIVRVLNVSEGRAIQMDEGLIEFCECRAAHMYRQYLRRVLGGMSMETRRNMREFVLAANIPTIHLEPTP